MTFDLSGAASGTGDSITAPEQASQFVAALSKALATMRVKGAALLRGVQLGRMKSVLMSMSDEQLARIGITRPEISRYAKSLMSEE